MSNPLDQYKPFIKALFLWINENPDAQKFTFNLGDPSYHITIRFYNKARVVDIHRTNENLAKDNPNRYETITKIKYFTLLRILVWLIKYDYKPLVDKIFKSKIKVGKLKKYNCYLVPLNPENPEIHKILLEKNKGQAKKIKINHEYNFIDFLPILSPEEAIHLEDRQFLVFRVRKGHPSLNGFVFRIPETKLHGRRSFLYVSPKIYWGLIGPLFTKIEDILTKGNVHNEDDVLTFLGYIYPRKKEGKKETKTVSPTSSEEKII